jgi:hypothetical protein
MSIRIKHIKVIVLILAFFGLFSVLEITPPSVFSQNNPTIACTQYPSGIATPSVTDSSIVDQEAYRNEGATWQYRWEADCTQGCSNNSDCTANTSNTPAVAAGTSAWCFQFTDGNRCMILTTTDKGLGEDKNKSGGKFGQGNATSNQTSNSTANQSSAACKNGNEVQKTYIDAKVANNLARFYAIQSGVAGLCVPSDLGVGTQETATATDGSTGRLLLCSGNDGTLVWKVVVGNSLKTANKPAPDKNTLETGFASQIAAAKSKLGI